jgi:oxygen-dependent protoporphyrinogen oxidase
MTYSTVGVITFAFAEGTLSLPEHGTGVLVPPGTPLPSGDNAGSRFLTTALTFLDRKWPHLAQPGTTLLRCSVGRIDDTRMSAMSDDDVMAATLEELRLLIGDVPDPQEATVTRWVDSLPQYKVNHLLRVGGIESGVERLGSLAICGAAYRGVGVPACVASGREAARRILKVVSGGR